MPFRVPCTRRALRGYVFLMLVMAKVHMKKMVFIQAANKSQGTGGVRDTRCLRQSGAMVAWIDTKPPRSARPKEQANVRPIGEAPH